MPVKYRLERLEVSGFRGIKDLDLELSDHFPLHLIGSNNAGKSTILQAIAFALRGGGFHQYNLEPFDFFAAANGEVVREFDVCLRLSAEKEEMLPAVQGVGQPVFVHALRAKGKTAKSGQISKHFNLLDTHGRPITFSPRTPLKGALKAELSEHSGVGWGPTSARHDHIRDELPEVMLLTPHNVHQSLFHWKTGPLNRLAAMLAEGFLQHEWSFEYGGKDRKMPDSIRSAHAFLSAAVERFPLWRDILRPKLSETLSEYVGRHTQIELKPAIQEIEEWLRQQLLLSFAADEQGTITPIESMGDGWKSLIRLAALDVLSQFPEQMKDTVVLLFEEPETHLHPHLRRRMRRVLDRLASSGWYVVTSTHSAELVDLASRQYVVRISRRGDVVTRAQLDTTEATEAVRIQAKINEQGNGELFFANMVILCEGKDDEFALKAAMGLMEVDLDGRSVSILGVGGKGNVVDYARLLHKLNIPWCAVLDEDRLPDGSLKLGIGRAVNELDQLRTEVDLRLQWEVDLEHCYGIARNSDHPERPEFKASPEWQSRQLSGLGVAEFETKYPSLASIIKLLSGWIAR